MKIVYCAQFRDNSGYAVAARGYLKALDAYLQQNQDAFELYVHVIPLETNNSKITLEEEALIAKYELEDANSIKDFLFLWHMPPPMLTWKDRTIPGTEKAPWWQEVEQLIKKADKNVNISAWEADKLPDAWVDIFNAEKTDAVIVPSRWNHGVYASNLRSSNIPVFHVPHVLEKSTVATPMREIEEYVKDKMVFLSVAQWQPRKGLHDLLRAYFMEFGKNKDAILILKTYINIMNGFGRSEEEQLHIISKDVSAIKETIFLPNGEKPKCEVLIIPSAIPESNLTWLYKTADAFVLPTRGEGFGLPIAEAMMQGTPVVVPDQGGHMDFVQDSNLHYPITGTKEPYEGIPGYDCEMSWYRADIWSVRRAMRDVYGLWKRGVRPIAIERWFQNFLPLSIGNELVRAIEETHKDSKNASSDNNPSESGL